jgi:hypothetical protein
MKMHNSIDIGTRVQFSAQHCRNTGQFTGNDAPTHSGPFARGEVIAWHKLGRPYVMVKWDDGTELGCNGANLWPCGIPEPA